MAIRMLDPPLPLEEESELISKTLLIVSKFTPAEQSTIDSVRDNFEKIVTSLFEKTPNTAVLDRILEHIFKYLSVKEEEVRKRAIKLFYAALENFYDVCAPGEDEEVRFLLFFFFLFLSSFFLLFLFIISRQCRDKWPFGEDFFLWFFFC